MKASVSAKIQYFSHVIKRKFPIFEGTREIDYTNIFLSLLSSVIIIILLLNILNVLNESYSKFKIIETEKQKLSLLKKENDDLKERLDYVKSDSYVAQKALEELNLSIDGSRIYYTEENKSSEKLIDLKEDFAPKKTVQRNSLREWIDLLLN